MTNVVTVTPPPFVPELDPANNTATDVDQLTPQARLVIDKQLDTRLVRGQIATYRITLRNEGPSIATGIVVTDLLPAGLEYVSASGQAWTCTAAPAVVVTCTLGVALGPNQSTGIELRAMVVGGQGAPVLNRAEVAAATPLALASVLADDAPGTIDPAPPQPPGGTLPGTGTDPGGWLSSAALTVTVGALLPASSLLGRRRARRRVLTNGRYAAPG